MEQPDKYYPRGLEKLAKDLPGMAHEQIYGVKKRIFTGAGNAKKSYTKVCPICGYQYGIAVVLPGTPLKAENCQGCAERLADGQAALITISKRFAFIKAPPGKEGVVETVSEKFMDFIQNKAKEES